MFFCLFSGGFKSCSHLFILWSRLKLCLFSCLLSGRQGSDGELRGEKDGMSDNESKVDSGVPEVPVPPDDTPEVLNKALSGLSSRYRHPAKINVWNRLLSKLLLPVLFT